MVAGFDRLRAALGFSTFDTTALDVVGAIRSSGALWQDTVRARR